jgi:glucosamine-6-phosphate deaminase
MRIIKAKNYNELSKKAATILLNEVMLHPDITIGFATGSTPLGLYKELIKAHKNMNVDFSDVKTFNLDEYYPIDKENSQSYYYFMWENLFKYLNLKKNNINLLDGTTNDPEKECSDYEQRLLDNGIDVQILGIGSNGHIAFNEPGSSQKSKTRVVDLSENTIQDNARFFENKKAVPKKALSMGLGSIMTAKKIIILATGKNKAEAVKKMVEGPVSEDCPASILQKHPNVALIIDLDAAKLLRKEKIQNEIGGYYILSEENIPKGKNIVVISPHPDDASIAAGGVISMMTEDNEIHTFVMTTGHRAFIPDKNRKERIEIRKQEQVDESSILKTIPHFLDLKFYDNGEDILDEDIEKLYQEFLKIKPDIVLIPQKEDRHPTHKLARLITIKALKKYGKKVYTWNYESPWALFHHGHFNTIVSVPERFLKRKIDAVKKHKSQILRTRYDIAAESLAKLRGALIPEQELCAFGENPVKISPYIELFSRKTVNK